PAPPGLTANLGKIGYLYNHFGKYFLSPTDGTGMQLALYELLYAPSTDLSSGDFQVNPFTTDAGAYASALNYLSIAATAPDERAIFLNVIPEQPTGDLGRQGMLVTETFSFANKTVVGGDLNITITPDDTNEVGVP